MAAREKLLELLETCGAKRVAGKRHPRYRLPNGKKITIPNDNDTGISWDNSYQFLRRILEPVAERNRARVEKLQQQPETPKKKEEYKPKVQPKREFLSSLPDRAFVLKPPLPQLPRPTPVDRIPTLSRAFEVNRDQPEPLPEGGPSIARASSLGPVHTIPSGFGKGHWQKASSRSGPAKSFSALTVSEANRILLTYGEEEYRKYMDSVHNQTKYEAPAQKRLEMEFRTETREEPVYMPEAAIPGIQLGGPIEDSLRKTKEMLQQLYARRKTMVAQIDFEIEKCNRTIAGLEQLVAVSLMTMEDFRTMVPLPAESTNGNGTNGNGASESRRYVRWRPEVELIFETSTGAFNRKRLRQEMMKLHPEVSDHAIHAALSQLFKSGHLVEVNPDGKGYRLEFRKDGKNESEHQGSKQSEGTGLVI